MGPYTKWERPAQRANSGASPGPGGENGASRHCTHRPTQNVHSEPGSQGPLAGRAGKRYSDGLVKRRGIFTNMTQALHPAIHCHDVRIIQKQLPGLCALQVPGGDCPPPQTQDGSQSQRMPPSEDRATNAVRQGNSLKTLSNACVDAPPLPPPAPPVVSSDAQKARYYIRKGCRPAPHFQHLLFETA